MLQGGLAVVPAPFLDKQKIKDQPPKRGGKDAAFFWVGVWEYGGAVRSWWIQGEAGLEILGVAIVATPKGSPNSV